MNIPLDSNTDITPLQNNDKCDKYDYLIAAGCGIISGLVDAFLVGCPGQNVLGSWSDTQIDKCVMQFAKMNGWNDNGKPKSAIGFLEGKFRINYDQRHSGDVGGLVEHMSTKNHHMKSLAHFPSPVGLFFSVLNQFTGTSIFASNVQLVCINSQTQELIGGNFIAKLFCGIANWFGHLMSDVAGSSGAVGRGSGIVIPFYELFNLCNLGNFNPGGAKMDLAQLATRAFEQGYDFRFGLTQAIPVILCDLSIRLIWSIRRYFGKHKSLKECIPASRNDDLRVMLLVGNGALCLIDGIDAVARSGGNPLVGFMRLNLIAWFRLAMLALKELCIRVQIPLPLQNTLDAFKRINAALESYLEELKKIDIDAFKRETERYRRMANLLDSAADENDLNVKLHIVIEEMGMELPWKDHDSFDDFMNDDNVRLVFD